MIEFIRKRSNDIVPFDSNRIKQAIIKAHESLPVDEQEVQIILDDVLVQLLDMHAPLAEDEHLTVEMIQDVVEKTLMKHGKFEIAKAYILYREEHQQLREQEATEKRRKLETHDYMVTKHSWAQEAFDRKKIETTYARVARGIETECPFDELRKHLEAYVANNISTRDILQLMVKGAINLISIQNTQWQYIAGRLSMLDFYKQASRNRHIPVDHIYSGEHYLTFFQSYVEQWRYYKDFFSYYSPEDIRAAGDYLLADTDFSYNYTTTLMLRKRYLLNPNKIVYELPQEMYMSVALFLAIPESKEKRLEIALRIYDYCSTQKISLPTPTLMNARTNFHQLSSCFKLNMDDDLRSIYHNIENMAQISKFGWGIGTYLWNIRSKWSDIRWVYGASWGVIPWIKVINDTATAVNQLWARAWAISITLDIWHKDVLNFLDLQTETWDIRKKSFDIFPAVSIPDIFMRRVMADGVWTLFDPKEVNDKAGKKLQDCFGDEFSAFYEELEKRDDLILKQTISAKELFKTFLKTVAETGMPYVFFRDTVNKTNPNRHVGNVYSSQLCTEICQNTSPSTFIEEVDEGGNINIRYASWDAVVCNLASINVAKVHTAEEIQNVIPIAMRVLDNVITLTHFPIREAAITAHKYRSVWLWFLGLAEYLATHAMTYDSQPARDHVDALFEQYAYTTLQASVDLAKERGAYELFPGSDRSKGILFGRTEDWYLSNSLLKDKWSTLIADIKTHGVRFSYHSSPAPNTSTSLVVGTTAGLLPIYKKYFVDNNAIAPAVNVAPKLSPQNMRYYKEYIHMKMPEVIDMIAVVQKWIDQSISFEWIFNPAETAPVELYNYYFQAWKQGIKTIYYVRSMSLDVKECSSCSG